MVVETLFQIALLHPMWNQMKRLQHHIDEAARDLDSDGLEGRSSFDARDLYDEPLFEELEHDSY